MPPDDGAVIPSGNPVAVIQPPGQPDADLFDQARKQAIVAAGARTGDEDEGSEIEAKMLRLVDAAENAADRYTNFVRKSWARAYRSFHNQHSSDSKYVSKDYAARSKIFRPKTRGAVRKAMAAAASALFSTTDAMAIEPGNEGDPKSRAGAALMQEVINYRLDRTSGRNGIKWFLSCMGAVQNATLTGVVASKQYWKLETKEAGREPVMQQDPLTGAEVPLLDENGEPVTKPITKVMYDRPDSVLIPPDQIIIDAGADWTDPAQSAAFIGIRWPMKIDDIRQREKDPRHPWRHLEDSVLRSGKADRTNNSQNVRNAREGGQDRYNETNASNDFTTIWVTEWFVAAEGEDWTFFSVGKDHLLTEPMPVEELYPWNGGERPIVIGYGSIEAHRIFPMSPAESWQQLQAEINDVANLTLDTSKMSIAPIAKVRKGRQVDLEKLRRRAPGTNILMSDLTDVEFDKPPGPDPSAYRVMDALNNDFDGLAGQFDQGSVQGNRQLNETVGGMKLLSGAANTVGEYDMRVVIETWAEPALAQVVRLCQFYEHDETILALCGDRAKLWQQYGVSEITDDLLDAQVTMRIDIGAGAGNPQQKLQNFGAASSTAFALLKEHPKFASGEYEINVEEVLQACYGPAGYRDGGARFLIKNPPKQGPSPAEQAELDKTKSETEKNATTAQLNKAKAQSELVDIKLRIAELITGVMTGQQERSDNLRARQEDRQDGHRDKMIERHDKERDRSDNLRARQEDREDARESREAEHDLARETTAMKAGRPAPKPKALPAPDEPDEAPAGGQQQIEFVRDAQGRIAGAQVIGPDGTPKMVKFQRGADGRIAGLSMMEGGGAPRQLPPPMLPPRQM